MDVVTFFNNVYEVKQELQTARHPQSTTVIVHRILGRLQQRFPQLSQQIRSEQVLPTLEELYTRLQMEENFQRVDHHRDPEEALVMRIRNVVCRRFT
jgi:hypothetical protein